VIDRFQRNFYGEMADAVNRGDRSDRFFVRWDTSAPPGPWSVALTGDPTIVRRAAGERPELVAEVGGDAAVIEIPTDHTAIRASDPETARAWREVVAGAAESCLGRGLVCARFDRERSAYVFTRTYGPARVDTVRSGS
jgi:predicted GNAT superfamily acetyltransferase